MKKAKFLIAALMAAVCATGLAAFAACEGTEEEDTTSETSTSTGESADTSTDPEVVAEGTGYASWGFECNFLYQEYNTGDVYVYVTHYMEGSSSIEVIFEGSVEKGTDDEGDAYVTLTLSSFTALMEEDSGEIVEVDESLFSYDLSDPTYSTMTTYTVSGTYDYTITLTYNMFGYYTLTPSIEVSETSSPTDPDAWVTQYIFS